uniref:Uncharacterized protein n=1 Tax=Aegilops tauschii subsp. strangulata TaxID=200361 RepID=A0A453QB07_AEGTS
MRLSKSKVLVGFHYSTASFYNQTTRKRVKRQNHIKHQPWDWERSSPNQPLNFKDS